jgi:hypothetical protein
MFDISPPEEVVGAEKLLPALQIVVAHNFPQLHMYRETGGK